MRKKNSRKRRLTVAALFALTVAVMAPLFAPSAGAVVANPGVLDVAMNLTVSTSSYTVAGMHTSASGAATMQKNGLINIPKASLAFDPVVVPIDLTQPGSTAPAAAPTTATVRAVATSDFNGGLDPGNGAAFIIGQIEEIWTQAGTMTSCVVGPFQIAARTNAQGGIGYSAKTGAVSMVDPGFTIDAVPAAATGCGGLDGAVNTALSLPVTTTTTTTSGSATTTSTTFPVDADPPIPSVVVSLTFAPAPRAVPVAPVQHPHPPRPTPPPVVVPRPPSFTPLPSVVSPQPAKQPRKPAHRYPTRYPRSTDRNARDNKGSSAPGRTDIRRAASEWSTRRTSRRPVRSGPTRDAAPKAKKAAAATAGAPPQNLNFTTAAFIKRPKSALATGLDLLGLMGLLGFSSLALWLVTTELSEFSAVSRRLRTHRIAGITK